MPLGIDPTIDYVFKKLFGHLLNCDLLIALLNAVLRPLVPIVSVQILNPFNEKEFAEDKLSVLDIKACDANRAFFNIEMQTRSVGWLPQRLPYYNARMFIGQLGDGEPYHQLLPAVTICILKDSLFPEVQAPHLRFVLSDCRHGVTLTDALQIHTVELAKYNFDSASISEADALTQWAFLLDRSADMEAAELKRLLPGPEFHKAIEIMETIARTPEERQLYEARRQAELDYRAGLDEAHARGWQEGERLGLEKGERLGLEKGRSEGRQEAERAVLVDQIRFLQDVLGGPVSSESELSALDLAVLRQTCAELRDRVQSQR